MTLAKVEDAIDKDARQNASTGDNSSDDLPVYTHLEKLLIDTFSSANALNISFPIGLTKLSYSRPNVDFEEVATFYTLVTSLPTTSPLVVLLNTILTLLKHPVNSIESPADVYFLLIIFELPAINTHTIFSNHRTDNLKSSTQSSSAKSKQSLASGLTKGLSFRCTNPTSSSACRSSRQDTKPPKTDAESKKAMNQESMCLISELSLEILERTVSILAHAPKQVRHFLLNWVSRYPLSQFQSKVELLNAYIVHKLTGISRVLNSSKHSRGFSLLDNLYTPSLSKLDIVPGSPSVFAGLQAEATEVDPESESGSSYSEQPAAGTSASASSSKRKRLSSSTVKVNTYGKDWKISAFSRLQAIYFNANIITHRVPVSLFYNTMVDYIDIKADFDAWERLGVPISMPSIQSLVSPAASKTAGLSSPDVDSSVWDTILFSFCEYPFFLSMGTKTNILEYDARRQMAHMAHEAFFSSLDTHIPQQLYFVVRVRRNHILHDSFQIFEGHENDLKKGIRVQFIGEPGIDVGGLKKEWFLLLIRELFGKELGLFKVEEDSGYNWFNTKSENPLKYYKLTGVALGLALYNSTILETNFPPVVFKKLLGASVSLEDFKVLMPSYGKSLQQLLDYSGDDFEDVFCLTFSVCRETESKGVVVDELVSNGADISVTKKNRHDYVKRIVAYHLDTSIKRQFEPLKQGFYKVAGSNSLALFQPEEIELLINGSEEPIDVEALRAVTQYNNWTPRYSNPDQDAPVVKWFWKYFKTLDPVMQRKLLMFVTGSDRIPATGIVTMAFKITRYGGNSDRYPVSHTCFNELCLYEYDSKQKLVNMITRAIHESEGFGLK